MIEGVETYVFNMDDSECRRAATFKYIDKMSWKKVAEQMGKGYTADGCRMMVERYIKKH